MGAGQSKWCVVVPAYEEAERIGDVVRRIREYAQTVLVVDDGSTDGTSEAARGAGAVVLRHERNRGKGAALNTAFEYARQAEFEIAITLDADGQHDPKAIPRFLEAYERTGIPVLIGNRMAHTGGMPLIRRLTNRYMSWLLSRRAGVYIPDTQCGYRLYRLDILPFVSAESERFAAESEILLRIAERGIRIDAVPIETIYRSETSKIRPIRDTVRFFAMLRRLDRARRRREWG